MFRLLMNTEPHCYYLSYGFVPVGSVIVQYRLFGPSSTVANSAAADETLDVVTGISTGAG